MFIFRALRITSAFALLLGAAPLEAQDFSFGIAAGAAIPVGSTRERRDAGPAAMLSVETRLSNLWSLRFDGEWSSLRGPTAPDGEEHSSNYQDLRALGASLSATRRLSHDSLAPYWLAGIGAYRLQRVGAPESPYGTTGAVQVGIGLDSNPWGRVNPFVEARAQIHLTDYGAEEFSPTIYWPVVIGIRFR